MGDYRLAIASKKNKEILSFLKVLAKDHPVAEFESNLRCAPRPAFSARAFTGAPALRPHCRRAN